MIIDATEHPHVAAGYQYALDVVSRKIDACEYVRQACQRQLDDLKRADGGWLYYFDHRAAELVCRFTCMLPHIKGPLAGQNLTLEPWQAFILTTAFGWLRHDNGKRRYRRAYTEVPRGNGKTTLLGATTYLFNPPSGRTQTIFRLTATPAGATPVNSTIVAQAFKR